MWHVLGRKDVRAVFGWLNFEGRNPLGRPDIRGRLRYK
jgi:hypothetical protein